MSIFTKFISAVRGDVKATPIAAPIKALEPNYSIPTVKFDPNQVTNAIKIDLRDNIKNIPEFDETNFNHVYNAALQSISPGRDLGMLVNAIMALKLPNLTKQRAGEISRSLNNKATALIGRDRQTSLGIKYAVWVYSGAPCKVNPKKPSAKDIRQDTAHKAADGKKYEVSKGMLLNGRLTMPGQDEGCKCISRSIIPGLDQHE